MKKMIFSLFAMGALLSATAQEPQKEEGYQFTDGKLVKTTSVKDQSRSGTCWCFSGLSFIENEVMKA